MAKYASGVSGKELTVTRRAIMTVFNNYVLHNEAKIIQDALDASNKQYIQILKDALLAAQQANMYRDLFVGGVSLCILGITMAIPLYKLLCIFTQGAAIQLLTTTKISKDQDVWEEDLSKRRRIESTTKDPTFCIQKIKNEANMVMENDISNQLIKCY